MLNINKDITYRIYHNLLEIFFLDYLFIFRVDHGFNPVTNVVKDKVIQVVKQWYLQYQKGALLLILNVTQIHLKIVQGNSLQVYRLK